MKVAFDVDGTLIVQRLGSLDVPNYDVIILYLWFQHQGNHMIIWSGSGIDYARKWAERLGLTADEFPVKEIRNDIDIAFDDSSSANLAKVTVKVK